MNTTLEQGLGLIANADSMKQLREIARWSECHYAMNNEDKEHIHEAIKSRIQELPLSAEEE